MQFLHLIFIPAIIYISSQAESNISTLTIIYHEFIFKNFIFVPRNSLLTSIFQLKNKILIFIGCVILKITNNLFCSDFWLSEPEKFHNDSPCSLPTHTDHSGSNCNYKLYLSLHVCTVHQWTKSKKLCTNNFNFILYFFTDYYA